MTLKEEPLRKQKLDAEYALRKSHLSKTQGHLKKPKEKAKKKSNKPKISSAQMIEKYKDPERVQEYFAQKKREPKFDETFERGDPITYNYNYW